MLNVTVDCQHIHADSSMSESDVLRLATKQAGNIPSGGDVLVDIKHQTDSCSCDMLPHGKGWMVILYYLEEREAQH